MLTEGIEEPIGSGEEVDILEHNLLEMGSEVENGLVGLFVAHEVGHSDLDTAADGVANGLEVEGFMTHFSGRVDVAAVDAVKVVDEGAIEVK